MPLNVRSVPVSEATGAAKALFEARRPPIPPGEVPKYVQAWSLQPQLAESWLEHGRQARAAAGLDDRRYEILCNRVAYNFRCASVLRNHAWILLQLGDYTREEILVIAHDWPHSSLDERDRAMLAFADKMCASSQNITDSDVNDLRKAGFAEDEVVGLIMLIGWRVSDAVNGNAFGLGDGDHWTTEMQEIIDWK